MINFLSDQSVESQNVQSALISLQFFFFQLNLNINNHIRILNTCICILITKNLFSLIYYLINTMAEK